MMYLKIMYLIVIGSTFITGTTQLSIFDIFKAVRCAVGNFLYIPLRGVNSNLNYNLYTRKNPKLACDLQPTGKAIKNCKFNSNLKTKVLIHGWVQSVPPESAFNKIKDKLLEVDNFNVVIFNWTAYTDNIKTAITPSIGYFQSAGYSFYVAMVLTSWIRFLQIHTGIKPSNIHFIAHSLGAEVSSYAGKMICTLEKITMLDAAGEKFRLLPEFLQPSYTDAEFVEAIHTDGTASDGTGFGYIRPLGNIDYYPNGGNNQPKCKRGNSYQDEEGKIDPVNTTISERSCNHDASFDYYIESFNKDCKFLGLICDSFENFTSGSCSSENSVACRMGYYSINLPNLPPQSKCYLRTSATSPYCLG